MIENLNDLSHKNNLLTEELSELDRKYSKLQSES